MKRVAIVLIIGLSGLALAVRAAESRGKFGVGLRASSQNVTSENDEENSVGMAGGGLLLRYRMSKRWGFEISSEHLTTKDDGGAFTREAQPVTLSASYHFGRQRLWDWYVLAGVGA